VNCRQSSRLLSEALDRMLTPEERQEVERHLAICPACTLCRRHFEDLRRALKRLAAGAGGDATPR
jgi:anti-sigma factor RsiW